jgi:hypothetical protein
MDTTTTKDKLARFGRALSLLLNRGLMYQKSHPMVKESINEVHRVAEMLFLTISPVVFILNREQFYVDEELLDPRINIKRIATLFKNHKIQSVSFENGLTPSELDIFIDLFATMGISTDGENLKKALFARGAFNIKINHVLYKKVTEDDQIVSREALKEVAPSMEGEDSQTRKKFMDTLLETILTEEFANTLNIRTLLANPRLVSQNMIKADLASARQIGGAQTAPGPGGSGPGAAESGVAGSGGAGSGGSGGSGGAGAAAGDGAGVGGPDGSGGGTGTAAAGPGAGGGSGPGASGVPAATDGMGAGGGTGSVGSATGDAVAGGAYAAGAGGSVVGIPATMAASGSASQSGTAVRAPGGPAGTPGTTGYRSAGGGTAGSGAGEGTDTGDGKGGHGPMLLHQLEMIQVEVQKQLEGESQVSLEDLADAVFEMKRQFFEDLETQKALGVAYANEENIVRNMHQLTDQVILKLIQEEYSAGKITTQRLAQIILRLLPEAQELKRLLPRIKTVLLEAGMPPGEYLELIDNLKKELENEDLTRILEESSEAIGVDSADLIDELKSNPDQAAKLIYLASEIGKGTGDEAALADILIDYVEKITAQQAAQSGGQDLEGEAHLKKVVSQVESSLLQQLGRLNVGDDVLARMENRINDRMDSIMDKMRVEWINAQAGVVRKEKQVQLTVLQTLEHSVHEDEELTEILELVRAKVEAGEIEENNFSQIQAEIERQRENLRREASRQDIPEGVLSSDELMFILEKEIARANRYNATFSALAFSFVSAKPKMKALSEMVTADAIMTAALEKLVGTIREVDYIGQIGKNKMVALLPMIAYPEAKKALGRVMNLLHGNPLKVHEVAVDLRVAGVVAEFKADQTPDAQAFAKALSNQLMDMVSRVKNIQVLF